MAVQTPDLSVVVPVFNAESTLRPLVERIMACLEAREYTFEIILTDDQSTDNSYALSKALADEFEQVRTGQLAQNSGQMAATLAGIKRSRGFWIFTLDDDLQYPPEEISRLLDAMIKGKQQIIFGTPRKRMHNLRHNLIARLVMLMFDYILLPKYRNVNFYTTFRILRRDLFFHESGEFDSGRNLFFFWEIPVNKMAHILVEHEKRKSGQSNQSFFSLLKHYRPQIFFGIKEVSFYSALIFGLTGAILSVPKFIFKTNQDRTLIFAFLGIALFFLLLNTLGRISLGMSRHSKYELEEEYPA